MLDKFVYGLLRTLAWVFVGQTIQKVLKITCVLCWLENLFLKFFRVSLVHIQQVDDLFYFCFAIEVGHL